MKTLISAAVAAIGLAVTAPASAVVVGGIDFGPLGGPPANVHLETASLAETIVNAVGDTLQAYGLIATVNGDSTYCAGNNANCSLYYYLNNYTVTSISPTKVIFTGGDLKVYYSGAPAINLLSQDSLANIAFITGQTPWVGFTGHTFFDPAFPSIGTLNGFGTLTGASLSETGQGQLDIAYGFGDPSVASFLDTNTISDNLGGFADVVLTASANNFVLNPFDLAGPLADSCLSGAPQTGDWCMQGTVNTRGKTPEPGTIALLGLGLFGAAFSQRRRKLPV